MKRYPRSYISVITMVEVLVGANTLRSEKAARDVLARFDVVHLDADLAMLTAHIRREKTLKLPDVVIYATAKRLNFPLLTRNTRDFSARDKLVEIPYQLH
jgi:hypothetical protein